MTMEDYTNAMLASLVSAGWGEEDDPDTQDWAREQAEELARVAAEFEVDTVLEKRGSNIQVRGKAVDRKKEWVLQ
jgi:hypothetical protein